MSSHNFGRTWWCRLADALGVVADVEAGGDRKSETGGGDGPLDSSGAGGLLSGLRHLVVRQARRHVHVCDHCQAQRAQWTQVIARLREVERPSAPDSLFDGLMAKIARERMQQQSTVVGMAGSEHHGASAYGASRPMPALPGRMSIEGDDHWLVPIVAVAVALGFMAVPVGGIADTVRRVAGASREAARTATLDVIHQAFKTMSTLETAGWFGGQLVVIAWCMMGLGMTAAVSVLAASMAHDR